MDKRLQQLKSRCSFFYRQCREVRTMPGCIIVGIVLLLVILDIFVFRHLYRKVGQLLEANKELRRLEDMIQNN